VAVPYSTYKISALVNNYLAPRLTDTIFNQGTMAWKKMSSLIRPIPETIAEEPIGINDFTGYARARSAQSLSGSTTLSDQPATRAYMGKAYQYWPIVLHDDDIRESKSPRAVADYMTTQIDRLGNAARQDMEAYIWTAQTGSYPYSLVDGINGCGPGSAASFSYANIEEADCEEWCSFTMESAHTTGTDTGVSPSLENQMKMIHLMTDYNGKPPDCAFVAGALWDHLAALIVSNSYIAANRGQYRVDWGLNAIYIADVPFYRDRNVPGAAYVGSASTRATQYGYSTYFVTWEDWVPFATPGVFMQFPEEWMRPTDGFYTMNYLRCEWNVLCKLRRTQGVIFNQDITIAATSHTAGTAYFAQAAIA
jgi:hypothetical protein